MKKSAFIKIIAFTVVAVMLLTLLCACGGSKLSGKYSELTFIGNSVEIEFKSGNTIVYTEKDEDKEVVCTYTGKYEIKDDRIVIDIDEACKLNGDHAFEHEVEELLGEKIESVSIGKYTFYKD